MGKFRQAENPAPQNYKTFIFCLKINFSSNLDHVRQMISQLADAGAPSHFWQNRIFACKGYTINLKLYGINLLLIKLLIILIFSNLSKQLKSVPHKYKQFVYPNKQKTPFPELGSWNFWGSLVSPASFLTFL